MRLGLQKGVIEYFELHRRRLEDSATAAEDAAAAAVAGTSTSAADADKKTPAVKAPAEIDLGAVRRKKAQGHKQ